MKNVFIILTGCSVENLMNHPHIGHQIISLGYGSCCTDASWCPDYVLRKPTATMLAAVLTYTLGS